MKYNREDCIAILKNKYVELQHSGLDRYPQRSDFEEGEVVAIKAFLGPWPRALEAAEIKPPRDDDKKQKNREKRLRAKRARIDAMKKEKAELKGIKGGAMTDLEIKELSLSEGFYQAEIISTDRIVFDASFRPYCEENLCGQYGINHSCPPACGTPEEMKQRVLAHKKALVVCTRWEIEDFSQTERIKEVKTSHNNAMFRVIKKMREQGHNGLMIGSSGCTLCKPCKLGLGEKCNHPELMYSCMSAYCIYVKKLAEECNMNYDYKDGILPFFGMYIFD